MIKVLFICHGNICRSPMAEFIFKDLVRKEGLEACFTAASAAITDEEIWRGVGNPIYPQAREELERRGVPYDRSKRAQLLTAADYGAYDLLIGMDAENMRGIREIVGADPEKKIFRLGAFTASGADVADPWYFGHFDKVFDQIEEGCRGILRKVRPRK